MSRDPKRGRDLPLSLSKMGAGVGQRQAHPLGCGVYINLSPLGGGRWGPDRGPQAGA